MTKRNMKAISIKNVMRPAEGIFLNSFSGKEAFTAYPRAVMKRAGIKNNRFLKRSRKR